jgi:hypothetical protein
MDTSSFMALHASILMQTMHQIQAARLAMMKVNRQSQL